MQSRIDPRENLRSADEVSGIHHPDIGRHFSFSELCFEIVNLVQSGRRTFGLERERKKPLK